MKLKITLGLALSLSLLACAGVTAAPPAGSKKTMSGPGEIEYHRAAQLVAQLKAERECGNSADALSTETDKALNTAMELATQQGDKTALLANLLILRDDRLGAGNNVSYENYVRALAIREQIFGPDSLEVSQVLNKLGERYAWSRKVAEAQEAFKRSLAIVQKHQGKGMLELAESMNVAVRRGMTAREGDVNRLYMRALRAIEKTPNANKKALALMWDTLALSNQYDQQSITEALEYSNKAIALYQSTGAKDALLADLYDTLGTINTNARNADSASAAVAAYKKALEIRQAKTPKCTRKIADTQDRIGSAYQNVGRYKEAEPFILAAFATWKKGTPDSAVNVLNAYNRVISFYHSMGEKTLEAKYREESLPYEAKWSEHSITGAQELGKLYLELKQYGKAEPLLKKWLASTDLNAKSYGPKYRNFDSAQVLTLLGKCTTAQGKIGDAGNYFERAKQIYSKDAPIDFLENYFEYLMAAKKLGDAAATKAEIERRKLHELQSCPACGRG